MPLERPVAFEDAARGTSLTVGAGSAPTLDVRYRADGLDLHVTLPLGQSTQQTALDDLAKVMAVPGDPQLAEQQFRFANLARRAALAMPTVANTLRAVALWLFAAREDTNYTYALTDQNNLYLAHLLALVTGASVADIQRYFQELESDAALQQHLTAAFDAQAPAARAVAERLPRYGRRAGWYAIVRALKPRLVIETGVDKGLGCVVLCAALLRNKAEGANGHYIGTDIRPEAGALLSGAYAEVGRIAYGDSMSSLRQVAAPIDLFINDSDHSAAYEAGEYQTVASRLSDRAVILGDNAHVTDELAKFAAATGRRFLFFREQPAGHFYPGGGIGIAFR